jgi:hypothetical protein
MCPAARSVRPPAVVHHPSPHPGGAAGQRPLPLTSGSDRPELPPARRSTRFSAASPRRPVPGGEPVRLSTPGGTAGRSAAGRPNRRPAAGGVAGRSARGSAGGAGGREPHSTPPGGASRLPRPRRRRPRSRSRRSRSAPARRAARPPAATRGTETTARSQRARTPPRPREAADPTFARPGPSPRVGPAQAGRPRSLGHVHVAGRVERLSLGCGESATTARRSHCRARFRPSGTDQGR